MKVNIFATALLFAASLFSLNISAKEGKLHIVTTGDLHGAFFPVSYLEDNAARPSMMAVKSYVDSLRKADGRRNVILLDAGDALQGDNAAYYFNYVATKGPHILPRLYAELGYDAVTVGNHDFETGHPVYDNVASQMSSLCIPWLAANALETSTGKSAFGRYTILRKGGVKVAVLGLTNPCIKDWLDESLYRGLEFESLIPFTQKLIDEVRQKENPDYLIVLTHSGTGKGDGFSLESQGLDLLGSLKGADLIVASHDHASTVVRQGDVCLVNAGARAARVAHVELQIDSKTSACELSKAEIVTLDPTRYDKLLFERFEREYQAVKRFTLRPVGELEMALSSRASFAGKSDFMDLIHTVMLGAEGVRVSFAAPLSYNNVINKGTVIYNDMFSIYQYENTLDVVRMSGKEIRDYLEYSYDGWITSEDPDHVLKIVNRNDQRSGAHSWSFVNRSYNFDSAGGLVYTVDVTKPYGQRINIISFADGQNFSPEESYLVAMTSYRRNGGGNLLSKGAGIPESEISSRVVAHYSEIRDLIYNYFVRDADGVVRKNEISDKRIVGDWRFVPEGLAERKIEADMKLLFSDGNL